MTSPTRHIRLHATTTEDGKGLAQLRDDLQKAARGVDHLGDRMSSASSDADKLDNQLVRVGRKAGTGILSGVGDAFGGLPGKVRGIAIAGIVAAAAAAAVPLGAMISGAVTGTVGLGGIIGGIAAASKSAEVRQAASTFASNISSSFFQMGDEFVQPLVKAFGILEEGWHSMNLEHAFNKVAAYVDDIARGLSGFGRNLMPGIERTLDVAGPALEILSRELPRMGDALGYMFARMAEGKGTLQGFYFLLGVVEATLKGVGNVLGWLSDRFYEFNNFVAAVSGFMEDIPGGGAWGQLNDNVEKFISNADVTTQVLQHVGRGFTDTATSVKATVDAINKLNGELYEQQNSMLALSDATLAYEADVIRLRQQVDEQGNSLARNTEKGNANRAMINRLIGDLIRERDAAIAAARGNKEGVDAANAAYARQIAALQRLLLKLGFEESQIRAIIGAYKAIPTRITTQIIQDYQTRGVPAGEHSGVRSGERRQHGGPVMPGVPYTINEAARETVTFPANGMVHPANLSPTGSAQTIILDIQIGGRSQRKISINEALGRGVAPAKVAVAYP